MVNLQYLYPALNNFKNFNPSNFRFLDIGSGSGYLTVCLSKLINDFLSSKVSLNEFTEKFKQLNQNFHYYSIIKDKLNLYK